ncbi:MerR family transcriptional regulator [Streptomyces sp. NPDC017202]|uniref:MerR family transcriptional regulator n=1 Tax=Streptomyces sp. NPDC017202 TaxID=3364981 RepID=UPI003799402F
MNDATLFPIGEVARRTGLSVKTIRFYSDSGVVPLAGRSPAGYRLYDLDALLRLDLVRTLRELGLGLAAIRRVLDRKVSVAEVAAVHADAVDLQIQTLRLRRSVLRAVADHGSGPEEAALMHKLTRLTTAERRRLIDEFIVTTFGAEHARHGLAAMVRVAAPHLPDDPSPAQVRAWAELHELIGDEDFRDRMRRAAERQADPAGSGIDDGLPEPVRERITVAKQAGIDPAGPEAGPVVESAVRLFAQAYPHVPDAEVTARLTERLEAAGDPLVERYWRLVWVVNGWQVVPGLLPDASWLLQALRENHTP